jgi:sugar phosphate isomerase/epimerase
MTRRYLLDRGLKAAASGVLASRLNASDATVASKPAGHPATKPSAQPQWQIGCYTRPWRRHDWPTAFDAIAEAGFKYIGLMSSKSETGLVITMATGVDEARMIGEEARKRGLKVASVYGGGFPVHESLEAGVQGLRKLVDNCAAAGSKTLMLGGTGDAKLYDRYCKAVAEAGDYAAEKKVGLVLKPHGGLNATGPQCCKTIELVEHRNFTLWYDPGNIYYYSEGTLDPVDDAATVAGIVTGMCVKDFTMSVKDGEVTRDVLVNPGDGRVRFPAVMTELKKGGFTHGPLIIETLAEGDLPTLLESARRARRFVEALVV